MGAGVSELVRFMNDATYPERAAFRITFTADQCYGLSATVEEVVGWESDTNEPAMFEPYLTCTIKWDSCSHFNFGHGEEKDGYIHMCGAYSFRNHAALMEYLYRLAFEAMGRAPMDGEEWEAQ